ncbi:HCP-like protein [Gonapodya prolifera JEL478]|uniref:HCP-like protein n=1 Tax=Gonapodya prolifera (strain JEL478) TaxID=1344416 RepID=A0A139AEW1_GONPJ|nr:HCP-like protein [Gonapodya prolifera JEL478]|eukprot:KXS15290.1 HCP-like protein [Gonapodya prolifera JEL478]
METNPASPSDAAAAFELAQGHHGQGGLCRALQRYRRAAELNHLESQYKFAEWCKLGIGLHCRDVEMAAKWYEEVGKHNHSASLILLLQWPITAVQQIWEMSRQTRLGFMLAHQYGVYRDYSEATMWWKKAAEQNFALAQVLLAECYLIRLGLPSKETGMHNSMWGMICEGRKDFEDAKFLYELAIKQGHAGVMTHLGDLYYHGKGSLAEKQQYTVSWYHRAYEQGYPDGRGRLGYCTYWGIGTGKNENRGRELCEAIGNGINEVGVTALARTRKINLMVKTLNLQNNSLSHVGATALAEMLLSNSL